MEAATTTTTAPLGERRTGTRQFVAFRLGDSEFAAAIDQVREILVFGRITVVPKVPDFIEGVVNVRGKIIPVLNLGKRFGIQGRPPGPDTRVVVVEAAEQVVGMIVDSVTEVIKVPFEAIEPPPALIASIAARFLLGIAKLEDRILVILNLDRVLSPEELLELKTA